MWAPFLFMEIKILGTLWISIHIIMRLGPNILLDFCGGLKNSLPENYHEVAKYGRRFFPPLLGWPTRWPPRDMPSSRGASLGWKRRVRPLLIFSEATKPLWGEKGKSMTMGLLVPAYLVAALNALRVVFSCGGSRMFPYLALTLDCMWRLLWLGFVLKVGIW